MSNSQKYRELARNPRAFMEYQRTGNLPQGVRPDSPLIRLIESIPPAKRGQYLGVVVSEQLGYTGRRVFHDAHRALHWLKPSAEVFGSFPAESHRLKHFSKTLTLADLEACCSRSPSPPDGATTPNVTVAPRRGRAP